MAEHGMLLDDQWRCEVETTVPGWLPIPAAYEGAPVDEWVARRAEALRSAWGEHWVPEHEHIVPELLRDALERRADADLLAFQVWTVAAPIVAFVHIGIVRAEALEDWFGLADVEVVPEVSRELGYGARASETLPGSAQFPSLTRVRYAFRDASSALVVAVEPTATELFGVMAPGLQGVLDSLRLIRPDGARFRGDPWPQFIYEEPWQAQAFARE